MEQFATIPSLQQKLQDSLKIINHYQWLTDAYVLDFYVEDHWSRLPKSWHECMEQLEPDQLKDLLYINKSTADASNNVAWPLSILALRQLLRKLSLCRKPLENELIESKLTQHEKLKHIFHKNVKPKKRHEVQRMAAACQQSCKLIPVDFVVDFGAGVGHLARVLGYSYGIKVCCLEMQETLNAQASTIDMQLEAFLAKRLSADERENFHCPVHVTLRLTADTRPADFIHTLKKALCLPNNDFTFGIIGLHPCGDLCSILMRMLLNCKQAKFINFVSCCYMKLSTCECDRKDSTPVGYPLSAYVKGQGSHSILSYQAREISCHALEMYLDRLQSKEYEYLKVHSYRAAAERVIIKYFPDLKHCGLRSVKHTPGLQFEEYFYKAVKGLKPEHLTLEEIRNGLNSCDLMHWKKVVIFYTLRLMLAPLVESVILYDRMLFLLENGCDVNINAIFDPQLSPRNHITSAFKRT